ncbi:predicted protein [Uncinocarpus reesii 1704]|uniref:HORMA domain-containing protein n=1 Tax=Uncinocarpus reesii (strain UAMH 1704) TaxID=336963 RepID=C4JDG3_UNCRE|nr:uncharacterized protein UREG_00376 [Uncinocarpus reesii 1704]EEP75530.1 predicted protein [Uncinocarpus reesii 1704]
MAHQPTRLAVADTAPPAADATSLPTTVARAEASAIVPPSSPTTMSSGVPDTYARLVSSFSSFLAVSMHQILYLRSVYPPVTFLPVREYNHPVKQSRHPRVCSWVSDACASVEVELLKSTLSAVSFVIVSARTNRPLERFTFDVSRMPRVSTNDIHTPFASTLATKQAANVSTSVAAFEASTSAVDMEAQFRAVLARLASACARLTPLPQHEEYRLSLFITVRPEAHAPAGVTKEEQVWIPTEPDSLASVPIEDVNGDFPERNPGNGAAEAPNNTSNNNPANPKMASQLRAQTVPVRRVDAGEMKLEVWVEEAFGKFDILDRLNSEYAI